MTGFEPDVVCIQAYPSARTKPVGKIKTVLIRSAVGLKRVYVVECLVLAIISACICKYAEGELFPAYCLPVDAEFGMQAVSRAEAGVEAVVVGTAPDRRTVYGENWYEPL